MSFKNLIIELHEAANDIMIDAYEGLNKKDEYFSFLSKYKNRFSNIFESLIIQSSIDNEVWSYCPDEVFVKNYEVLLKEYLIRYKGKTELEFIEEKRNELRRLYITKDEYYKNYDERRFYLEKVNERLFIYFFKPINNINVPDNFILNIFITQEILNQLRNSFENKIIFLENKYDKQVSKLKTITKNLYPRIFKDYNAFRICNELIKDTVSERTKLADCSFIYRQLKLKEHIFEYIGDREFKDYLFKEYKIKLTDQLKTIDKLGNIDHRLRGYRDCIELINKISS